MHLVKCWAVNIILPSNASSWLRHGKSCPWNAWCSSGVVMRTPLLGNGNINGKIIIIQANFNKLKPLGILIFSLDVLKLWKTKLYTAKRTIFTYHPLKKRTAKMASIISENVSKHAASRELGTFGKFPLPNLWIPQERGRMFSLTLLVKMISTTPFKDTINPRIITRRIKKS